jgi:hypothetical protein
MGSPNDLVGECTLSEQRGVASVASWSQVLADEFRRRCRCNPIHFFVRSELGN